jgi:hypothetical protein
MKALLLITFFGVGCLTLHAQKVPASMFAEWKALPAGVLSEKWTFRQVSRPVADGGSIFYDFTLADGQTVSVVAAHPSYWTKEDFQKSRQPFFLYAGKKMHRFDSGTPEEKAVKDAIATAAAGASSKSSVPLRQLQEQIQTRKPLFNKWSYPSDEPNRASPSRLP